MQMDCARFRTPQGAANKAVSRIGARVCTSFTIAAPNGQICSTGDSAMRSNTPSLFMRFMGALASLLTAILFVGIFAGLARSQEIKVEIDQATLVRLDRPGVEIIIGNPSIADVAVQSRRLLVVTGKSAGLTNLVVLDGAGKVSLSKKISVSTDAKRLVTVNRGAARQTYSCAPACDPALIPGDSEAFFEPLAKEIRNKLGLAQSSVDGTTTQQ